MSNQPKKKSDMNKQWMKSRGDREVKIAPEYHLIVTEGTKTEPKYFKALKEEINKGFPGRISIEIEGVGEGTVKLFERARKIVERSPENFSHIWLVYDKDDFAENDFDSTASQCEALSDENLTYHALWSNECIEYWFLLHYIYLDTALHRSEYYPKLSKHLKFEYKKDSDGIYSVFKPKLQKAIKNAKKIMESHGLAAPSKCTPGTKVYELFEKLATYIK